MSRTISGHEAVTTSTSPLLVRVAVPGADWTILAHKDYAPILASVAAAWHREVAPLRLDPLECWSYAYRPPRLGSGVSDHAGYAIDVNSAHEGAQGCAGGMVTMSSAQLRACKAIADRYRPVVYWGGPVAYGGQYGSHGCATVDPMHWYIRPGATPQAARDLLAELEGDVALSDDDVERIADAVWTRLVTDPVTGEKKKLGSLLVRARADAYAAATNTDPSPAGEG